MQENRSYQEAIKSHYNSLSKSEKRVADLVLASGYEISQLTLSEIATRSGVSDPSVVRFTKALGYGGFSDFKAQVLHDWGKNSSQQASTTTKFLDLNISPNDKLEDLPQKIFHSSVRGLEDTMNIFDQEAFQKAVTAINQARRIEVFGMGTSDSIALDFVSKLIRIGLNARYFADNHLEQLSCVSLTGEDVAIAISHSGSTIASVDTLKIAKQAGATTIAMTNYKASHILKYSDIALLTGDHETTFYSETMVSRLSLLSLVDTLYMGVLISDYEKYTDVLHKINTLVEDLNYH